MDTPFKPLLDRNSSALQAEEHFSTQLKLLKDVVNYGSNLVPSCFTSSQRNLGDAIAITVFLKQVVASLDAIHVLGSNACVHSCWLQVRALFEASVYLDYLFKGDKSKKAEYYYISNIRRELHWTKVSQSDQPEREQLLADLGSLAGSLEKDRIELEEIGRIQLSDIESFLQREPWSSINAHFDELRGNRPFDVSWYRPLGLSSLRKLSNEVDRLSEYVLLYSKGSEVTHVADYKPHVKFSKENAEIVPIRHLADMKNVIILSLFTTLRAYRSALAEYRPAQIEEFGRRYRRDWQAPFDRLRSTNYVFRYDDLARI